jgi:integrase
MLSGSSLRTPARGRPPGRCRTRRPRRLVDAEVARASLGAGSGVPFGELAALIRRKGREDLVFTAPAGGVLRVSTWRLRVSTWRRACRRRRCVDPSCRRRGFPIVTPHDLRHTAASLAISAGANPRAVQMMLGHAPAVLTLDTYTCSG